jgi:pimeloyl-ACP methyl ester carboxylesterase
VTPVFIHGAGFTAEVFANQRPAFPGAKFPNLPGHACPGSASTIDDFAQAIEQLAWPDAGEGVVLCGHSMGGAIALQVALRGRLALRGIVLIGSGARMRVAPAILQDLAGDYEGGIERLAPYFFADPTPERIDWATSLMRTVGPGQTLRDFRVCDAFDVLERLGEISVPLLALTGDSDRMTPSKYALALADRVPGAQARIIAGAGHFVMVEQAEETNAHIAAFLSGLP